MCEIIAVNITKLRKDLHVEGAGRVLPVMIRASADAEGESRSDLVQDDVAIDQIAIPPEAFCVEIVGDSMAPVVLDGQFRLVGRSYWNP